MVVPTAMSQCTDCATQCSTCSQGYDCCGCCRLQPVKRTKESFFQLLAINGGWIGTEDDDFSYSDLGGSLRVAVPLGSRNNILAMEPGFRSYFLNGPTITDVPEQVYDAGVSFFWKRDCNDCWSTMVWARPMVRSDFESSDDNFYLSAAAFATYTWLPDTLEVSLGAVYLDRDDVSLLPAAGVLWTPSPLWRYELIFPKPRIAYLLSKNGTCSEKWAYLGGSLGGGSFAVQRASGLTDELTIHDLRLVLGVETVKAGGGGLFAEIGYVFDRELEYRSNRQSMDFDDAFMVRGGLRF